MPRARTASWAASSALSAAVMVCGLTVALATPWYGHPELEKALYGLAGTDGARNLRSSDEHGHGHDHSHDHDKMPLLDAVTNKHFTCGVGHHQMRDVWDVKEVTVPQEYHTPQSPEVRRRLANVEPEVLQEPHMRELQVRTVNQGYPQAAGGGFLTVQAAHALSPPLTGGIRITPVWDVIEGADYSGPHAGNNARQCTAVGKTISVTAASGSGLVTWSDCAQEDIARGVNDDKLNLMKLRTQWAADFFNKALKIKNVAQGDSISIHSSIMSTFNLPSSMTSVPNTDLVVIMTARPSPWVALNGYAVCLQRDQYGRCTVGQFNWVPNVLNVADKDAPETINAQRHTALHELVHVLGGIGPSPTFIDSSGNSRTSGVYTVVSSESPSYPKVTTKMVTTKVLNVSRTHFGCATMDGVPIEDQPTGRGAHWEARIFGPELMSYGTGTGETYFGDVTFAFLEDTNQYIANYSMGGRLVETKGDTRTSTKSFDIKVRDPPEKVPDPPAPGLMRWGRNLGCDFVNKAASEWDLAVRCAQNREFSCTPDNRLSAVCSILSTWSLAGNGQFSCGKCTPGRTSCYPSCDATLNDNCGKAAGDCGLPSMFQYFSAATAKDAFGVQIADPTRVGGFSSAMDFAPVRIGYWNCQDATPSTNGSSLLGAESGGKGFSLSSLTNGAEENMKLFGGQAYCADCRCFTSSLMDFSSGSINPNFPRFGLCYRANCFRKDYLQFAIEGQLGSTTWYKCPSAGGKVYIAGFSGAFHCPKAEDFCQFETISGVRYNEKNPIFEWIFWGTATTLPLLFMIICLIKPCREHCLERSKKWCGVNHFTRNGTLDMDAELDEDTVKLTPPHADSWGRVLQVINGIVAIFAAIAFFLTLAGIFTGKVSIAGYMLISLSLTTFGISFMGARAGRKAVRGTSCLAVAFFFAIFFACIMFAFAVLYAMAYPEAMGGIIERQWPKIADTLPDGVVAPALEVGEGEQLLNKNSGIVTVTCLSIAVVLALQLIAIIKVLNLCVVAATTYTVINWTFLFGGICFWVAAGYAQSFSSGLDSGVGAIVAALTIFGLYLILVAVYELWASHRKTVIALFISLAVSSMTFLFALIGGAVLFSASRDVRSSVDKLSEDKVNALAQVMGVNGSRDDVIVSIQNNLRTVGMVGMCCLLMVITLVVSNLYFLWKVKDHYDAIDRGEDPRRHARRARQAEAASRGIAMEAPASTRARGAARQPAPEVSRASAQYAAQAGPAGRGTRKQGKGRRPDDVFDHVAYN